MGTKLFIAQTPLSTALWFAWSLLTRRKCLWNQSSHHDGGQLRFHYVERIFTFKEGIICNGWMLQTVESLLCSSINTFMKFLPVIYRNHSKICVSLFHCLKQSTLTWFNLFFLNQESLCILFLYNITMIQWYSWDLSTYVSTLVCLGPMSAFKVLFCFLSCFYLPPDVWSNLLQIFLKWKWSDQKPRTNPMIPEIPVKMCCMPTMW